MHKILLLSQPYAITNHLHHNICVQLTTASLGTVNTLIASLSIIAFFTLYFNVRGLDKVLLQERQLEQLRQTKAKQQVDKPQVTG